MKGRSCLLEVEKHPEFFRHQKSLPPFHFTIIVSASLESLRVTKWWDNCCFSCFKFYSIYFLREHGSIPVFLARAVLERLKAADVTWGPIL